MTRCRIEAALHLLDPPKGRRLWYGGPSAISSIRGVTAEAAIWKPLPDRHNIWELTLHVAYWKYAVRRVIDGSPKGTFPRRPANWPTTPKPADAEAWKKDRALLRDEHNRLVAAARIVDPARLDQHTPEGRNWTFGDLLFGAATHDIYHVGQIQLLKRLYSATR